MDHLAINHADAVAAEVDAILSKGAWRYRVTFRDLDADAVIARRTFQNRASAVAYADALCAPIAVGATVTI
jgi:hypothetical protein